MIISLTLIKRVRELLKEDEQSHLNVLDITGRGKVEWIQKLFSEGLHRNTWMGLVLRKPRIFPALVGHKILEQTHKLYFLSVFFKDLLWIKSIFNAFFLQYF